jgi:hypothetical protein
MLGPRVRAALVEYQQGRRDPESAARLLAHVRRGTGCLELYASASSGPGERALRARFAEWVAQEGGADPTTRATGVCRGAAADGASARRRQARASRRSMRRVIAA